MTRLLGYMGVRPGNPQPTLIVAVLNLEKDPGIARLRNVLKERILSMPRFRSRLVFGKGKPHWEEVELDLGYHFEVYGFSRKVSEEEVSKVITDMKIRGLDLRHPLWRCVHIPEMEDGTSRLIFCIHHCIGDGVGLVNVLLFRIVDEREELETKSDATVKKRASKPNVSKSTQARVAVKGFFEGHTGVFWKQDRRNPLKLVGVPSQEKLIARSSKYISLDQVKLIAKTVGEGTTINDVLMATFSKTLGYYMRDICHEESNTIKSRKLRAQFPVNMRKKGEKFNQHGDPNNQFVLGMIHLPMKEFESNKELILAIKRNIDEYKVSPAA